MLRDEEKELIVRFIGMDSYDDAIIFEIHKMNNNQGIISILHFKMAQLK